MRGFVWGAATASYQIEGAVTEDGRGPSIWDHFCSLPGRVYDGASGAIAVDHYHRYREDVELLAGLGVDAYRFSIAWPRIFPDGHGKLEERGLDFYKRLLDCLEAKGIEPWATLYHWDLPLALEEAGGWRSRDTAYRFADYAQAVYRSLGDRIKSWITLNEPWCSAFLGHLVGEHAPGMKDATAAYRALHGLLLGHGLALQAFRHGGHAGRIGLTLNPFTHRAATPSAADALAADWSWDRDFRMFFGPLTGKGYPQRHLDALGIKLPVEAGDLDLIAGKLDFLGVNYYSEELVASDPAAPEGFKKVPVSGAQTAMGWPIVPDGLGRLLRHIIAETGDLPLYITENGAAFADRPNADGSVNDPQRIDYLRAHLHQVEQAVADGLPIKGYFVWSLIDNFEWAHGYRYRFGVVHCDYATLRRQPKDSYSFYRDWIAASAS